MAQKRLDIMVDIETLGTEADSTIFQIAAATFDINTGEILSKFNEIADIGKNETMSVTGDTIKWWLNTNKELLHALLSSGTRSSEDTLRLFQLWLKQMKPENDLYLWGNGILFDNKMIEHQLESMGLEYPIFFRNDRDVRTIVELASVKLGMSEKGLKTSYEDPSLIAHDAFDDVIYQIQLVVGCYKALTL